MYIGIINKQSSFKIRLIGKVVNTKKKEKIPRLNFEVLHDLISGRRNFSIYFYIYVPFIEIMKSTI